MIWGRVCRDLGQFWTTVGRFRATKAELRRTLGRFRTLVSTSCQLRPTSTLVFEIARRRVYTCFRHSLDASWRCVGMGTSSTSRRLARPCRDSRSRLVAGGPEVFGTPRRPASHPRPSVAWPARARDAVPTVLALARIEAHRGAQVPSAARRLPGAPWARVRAPCARRDGHSTGGGEACGTPVALGAGGGRVCAPRRPRSPFACAFGARSERAVWRRAGRL